MLAHEGQVDSVTILLVAVRGLPAVALTAREPKDTADVLAIIVPATRKQVLWVGYQKQSSYKHSTPC